MTKKYALDRTGMEFTRRWFLLRNRSTFIKHVVPEWAGKPITYLELGVFEGMSAVWMFQHILTHPDSRAVLIDPFLLTSKMNQDQMDLVRARAEKNLMRWTVQWIVKYEQWTCKLVRANSVEALTRMRKKKGFAGITRNSVDLCMIDGDHNSGAVVDDARMVLPLMRKGGHILFDDVENDLTKQHHVKQGLALFLEDQGDQVKFLWKHKYMEAYKKL